jgi:hypothetical protein
MHRYLIRPVTAAAAAGAMVTTFGLASAGTAQAAAARHGLIQPVYATTQAGYLAGNGTSNRFRFVTATFTVTSCSDPAASHGWTGDGVEIGANSLAWTAEITTGCDSGGGAPVSYQTVDAGHANAPVALSIDPPAGTSLTMSIYYSRQTGLVHFTVTDADTGDTDIRTHLVGGLAAYYGAEIRSVLGGAVSAPPADVRTALFSRCALTTYHGARGSLLGRWPTSQIIATSTGLAGGAVIANAPVLWKGGRKFGVWERTTA